GILDEVRRLLGALSVDDPADLGRLAVPAFDHPAVVGDERHRPAGDGAMTADHLRPDVRLELDQPTRVEHAVEYGTHVVAHTVVGGKEVVEVRRISLRRRGRRSGPRAPGQPRDVLADPLEALRV